LKHVDVAQRQVMLEARIVVVENVNLLNLGTQWTWPTLTAGAFSNSELHGRQQPAAGPSWPWGIQLGYTPGKEFTEALLLTLNLLSQNNQATVIANPQVMAQSGETAEIGVKTEEYFEILTQGIYTRSELEKIEAGTMLEITPTIAANGEITLVISTEVSDVVARGKNNLPVVTRRTTSGTVRVQDGGTVVVAGLMHNQTRTDHQEVPGIGGVPVLGRLFRNDTRRRLSRQLLVFVTPRLLEDGGNGDTLKMTTSSPIKPVGKEFQDDLRKALERRGKRQK